MPRALSTWRDEEAIRRTFLLTPEDLLFLQPTRADAQRLYRALVLLWARVEHTLVSDPSTLPTQVIAHVSKQLGLKPAVLAELRNHPSARSATFEAVRTHLKVRAWEPKDADVLSAYLISKVAQTGNTAALFDAATEWLTRQGVLRPQGEETNLGLSTMAHSSGLPLHELERVYDWYFREETLRTAISRLISYHGDLPLTSRFGDGATSSSDGIRFGMAASTLNARHNPRYFGMRKGVTLYNHTNNRGEQYYIDVVNCLVRESTYVLDGLLYQDAPAIAAVAKQGDPVAESIWKHLSAIQWEHIHLVGAYHFTDVKLEGEFRPLREYQGKSSEQEKMAKIAQIDEGQENTQEESMLEATDETLPLIQLSLLSPDDAVS